MAENNLAGTIVSQDGWNGSWNGYGTPAQYSGAGYDRYYVYILQFTTPAFTGNPELLRFSIRATSSNFDSVRLRFALCTSDANRDNYRDTYLAVSDSNQLAAGTVTFDGLKSGVTQHTIEIPCSSLQPSTTYFLFLWAYNSTSDPAYCTISNTSYHTVSLDCSEGGVLVVVDGETVQCMVDIYSGGAWIENVTPEVYQGGAWVTSS